MKELKLKKMVLQNFKGVKEKTIVFNDITNIRGANASGKTTIFDGFVWLMFGKDSTGRKDFEIKTLDNNGEALHGLDHSVTAEIEVNGKTKTLKKIYHEVWTKRRGEAEKQFTGHETLYYIDDEPMSQGEYNRTVGELCREDVFKMITNPLYFGERMSWKERREIIISLIGDISVEEAAQYNPELLPLIALIGDKDVDSYRRILASEKKKLNDDLKVLPARIDEARTSIKELDFVAIEKVLKGKQKELEAIEKRIVSFTDTDDLTAQRRAQYSKILANIEKIERDSADARSKVKLEAYTMANNLGSEVASLTTQIKSFERDIETYSQQIDSNEKKIVDARAEWQVEHDLLMPEIDEKQFICPTCKRSFESADIENKKAELIENFNAHKAEKLKAISAKGKAIAEQNNKLLMQVDDLKTLLRETTERLSTVQAAHVEAIKEYEALKDLPVTESEELVAEKEQLALLKQQLESSQKPKDETAAILAEKKAIQAEIDSLKSELNYREYNTRQIERAAELEAQEKKLAQQIADAEKAEFLCETFIRTKVELLEKRINEKFSEVNFKLFDNQINGGLSETCQPVINGVPFMDANNAAKYNAGLDIINTLCEHFDICAPIFIDNREGILNIIPTKGQVVNLIVADQQYLTVN